MLNDFSNNEVDELEELCTFYKEYGWLYLKKKMWGLVIQELMLLIFLSLKIMI